LATRIAVQLRLEALDRASFGAAIEHAFKAAGATQSVLSDPAVELLFCSSVMRIAAKLLRAAMRIAADKNQPFVDAHPLEAALAELGSTS
jgi:type II secretory pathway predicted ATPase ExeA